ncbi:MAG TPA: TonB family protein [Bacteroidales bacterium]
MRLLVLLFLFVNLTPLFSQKIIDTVYLNKNFEKTKKPRAVYYRCISKDTTSGLFRIMEYQRSGEMIRMGLYKEKSAQTAEGMVTRFYPNGKIKHEAIYVNGKLNGLVKSYYNNGNVMREEKYANNQLVSGKYYTMTGKDTTLLPYFRFPNFKEGNAELEKFLQEKIIYPSDALRRGLEGTVVVGFLVQKNGYINQTGVLSTPDEIFNKEAVRLIELTKYKWNPGIDEGEYADMAISYPIIFKIK